MSDLQNVLAAYARSYETYDAERVADFIYCPCIFFLRNECVLLDSEQAIVDFLRKGLDSYRAGDCVRFDATLLEEKRIGPRFAIIDVDWTTRNAAGDQTMAFTTTYNLVRDADAWKIGMITRHDP